MIYNFKVPFCDINGKPVLDEAGNPTIIGEYVAARLFNVGGADIDQDKMLKLYKIAKRITDNISEVELSHEDIVLIEDEMSKILTIGAWGQLYDLLER
jgi:hypothetical protein